MTIGTPHHGAPLERGGNLVQLLGGVSRYSAPIAKLARIRSAGVTDLRFGNVLDEHWSGRDRFGKGGDPRRELALPEGVACFALAGTTAKSAERKKLPGDGMVPVDSALGRHAKPELTLFSPANVAIAHGIGHLELLGAGVYPILRDWLKSAL